MKDDRWEYRIWTEDGLATAGRIAETALKALDAEYRTDHYLLGDDERLLAKVRAGEMFEIKERLETKQGCEHWMMAVSEPFPLDGGAVSPVFPVDGRFADAASLIAAAEGKAPVHAVRKHRRLFEHDEGRAEATQVLVGKRTMRSYAIECPSLDACMTLAKKLGLDGYENEDYGTFLRRL